LANGRQIPFDSIEAWYFWGRYFFVVHREGRFLLRASVAEISRLREQFHRERLAYQGSRCSTHCSECGAPLAASESYCPDCLSIVDEGRSLCSQGRYFFNFCSSGFFDLVGRSEERLRAHAWLSGGSLYCNMEKMAAPFWRKIESHLIWLVAWMALFFVAGWLPWEVASVALSYLSGILLFLSFSLICSYLLMLFFRGWFFGRLRPPPWARLTRRIKRGDLEGAREEMERRDWMDHPGLLFNLAHGYLRAGDRKSAAPLLDRLRNFSHPLLNALLTSLGDV